MEAPEMPDETTERPTPTIRSLFKGFGLYEAVAITVLAGVAYVCIGQINANKTMSGNEISQAVEGIDNGAVRIQVRSALQAQLKGQQPIKRGDFKRELQIAERNESDREATQRALPEQQRALQSAR